MDWTKDDTCWWKVRSLIFSRGITTSKLHLRYNTWIIVKKISLSSTEPAFSSYVSGKEQFHQVSTDSVFTSPNANKYLSAIADLYKKQCLVLGKACKPGLRDFPLIETWTKNVINSEIDVQERYGALNQSVKWSCEFLLLRLYSDRQKDILIDDPFEVIKAQSNLLLERDSWNSHRLRCIMLCQLWSISRFDELSKWRISDLFCNTFTTEANPGLKMAMTQLYFLQFRHKSSRSNASKSKKPQKKLIVRRSCPSICPQSALALWFYHRFVLDGEKEVDLLTDPKNWQGFYFQTISTCFL